MRATPDSGNPASRFDGADPELKNRFAKRTYDMKKFLLAGVVAAAALVVFAYTQVNLEHTMTMPETTGGAR